MPNLSAFSQRFERLFSTFLLLSVLLLFLTPAQSQNAAPTATPTPPPPLQMRLSSPSAFQAQPLSIAAHLGQWFPVGITLSNTGEDVSGEVSLKLNGDSQTPPNSYRLSVEMPQNSRKTVWLYGRIDRAGLASCDVTFAGRGFRALSQRVDLRESDPEQRFVVSVADNNDGVLDTLQTLRGQALFRSGKNPTFNPNLQPVRAVQIPREGVPDRWIGLEGAELVILGDFPHIALSPNQLEALRGYAQNGGTILVMGGANAARLASSPLREMWPVTPQNSATASASEVAQIVQRHLPNARSGGDRLGGAPVVVTRATPKTGAIVREGSARNPLFVARDFGAGRVIFLAYDAAQPPFKAWDGQGSLWREIFVSSARVPRFDSVDAQLGTLAGINAANAPANFSSFDGSAPQTATDSLLQTLSRAPQLKLPPVSEIAWFLAVYLFFLVPVNYAVLRVFDRREWAWFSVPLIVLVFSGIAYSRAIAVRGTTVLARQVDVVQTSNGASAGRVDSLLWLFSPRRSSYALQSPVQGAVFADYANEAGIGQGALSIVQPPDGTSFQIENVSLTNADRAFVAQSSADLGRGLALRGNEIVNGSKIDWKGAVWVQEGRFWPLGELRAGAKKSLSSVRSVAASGTLANALATTSRVSELFDVATNSSGIPVAALRVIFGDEYVPGARASAISLLVLRSNQTPSAFPARKAQVSRAAFEPFAKTAAQKSGGFAFFDAILPQTDAAALNLEAAGVDASAVSRPQFEAWNSAQNRWQTLEGQFARSKNGASSWTFRASVPRSFARRPDNSLRVRVRLPKPAVSVSRLEISAP